MVWGVVVKVMTTAAANFSIYESDLRGDPHLWYELGRLAEHAFCIDHSDGMIGHASRSLSSAAEGFIFVEHRRGKAVVAAQAIAGFRVHLAKAIIAGKRQRLLFAGDQMGTGRELPV